MSDRRRVLTGRSKSFYTPVAFRWEWERFVELCRRDGISASRRIRELIESYLQTRASRLKPPLKQLKLEETTP